MVDKPAPCVGNGLGKKYYCALVVAPIIDDYNINGTWYATTKVAITPE